MSSFTIDGYGHWLSKLLTSRPLLLQAIKERKQSIRNDVQEEYKYRVRDDVELNHMYQHLSWHNKCIKGLLNKRDFSTLQEWLDARSELEEIITEKIDYITQNQFTLDDDEDLLELKRTKQDFDIYIADILPAPRKSLRLRKQREFYYGY
jgi:hypothetical protein